ncbi:helix-turn-helix transcriptional regulator [Dickeya dianthicola]|uniref:helix-turn-helix transcriptional regulator n=1 Tax=Dickeya dianthicola TaxID=204039 RepID=UPI003019A352
MEGFETPFFLIPRVPQNHAVGSSYQISGGSMAIKRLLKIHDVLHRCSISRSSLYRLIAKGYFPSQVLLSPEGRGVGWLEEEIEGWIASRKPVNEVKFK